MLRLAAKGMAGKQIARALGISPKTVEQHKTRAFKRLGVPNQAPAVAVLTERGGRRGAHPLPESPPPSLVGDRGVGRRRERGGVGDDGSLELTARSPRPDSTTYSATTMLWNPGAPTIGPAVPLPDPATLANLVTLPDVASIAAQSDGSQGNPVASSFAGVRRRPTRVTGLFGDHGNGGEPRAGRRGVDRVLARPHHVPRALEAEADRPAAAAGRSGRSRTCSDRAAHADRDRLAPIDARPARARSNDADPARRSSSRRRRCATPLPNRGPGVERHPGAEEPALADRARRPPRTPRRRGPRARAGAVRHQDPFTPSGGGGLRPAGAGRGARHLPRTPGNDRDGVPPVFARGGRVPSGRRRDRAMDLATHGTRTGTAALHARRPSSSPVRRHVTARPPSPPTSRWPTRRPGAGSWSCRAICGGRPSTKPSASTSSPASPTLLDRTNGDADPASEPDLAPYLEPCSVVRVAVIPSGVASERPGELLGSAKMQRFLERLKKITDVVILDCAPLVVASDVVPLLPAGRRGHPRRPRAQDPTGARREAPRRSWSGWAPPRPASC